jgi:hypothetical protein
MFALIMLIPLGLLRGWVISIMWGWFVVPLGILPLSIVHATGLGVLITMLVLQKTSNSSEENEIEGYVASVVYPIFFLGIGWLWNYLM